MRFAILFAVLMSPACATVVAAPERPDLATRRKTLNDLLAERWEYTLRTGPIAASLLGDKRWNDKLDDFSQKAIDDNVVQDRKFLARFEQIDTAGFPEQEALNKALSVHDLRMAIEGARFKPWEMPVSQFAGVHIRSAATGVRSLVSDGEGLRRLYFAAEAGAALLRRERDPDAQRHGRPPDAAARTA